jgi:transporter family-2 protein
MPWVLFLLALAAGAANPLQSGSNAQLNRQLLSPVWAGILVYATGLLGLLLVQLFLRQPFPTTQRFAQVDGWAWLGGVVSIASTMAGLTLAQKLGSGVFTGLSVTAAIAISVLLDQFGWIGFRQHSASPGRFIGCGLMILGMWLVARF